MLKFVNEIGHHGFLILVLIEEFADAKAANELANYMWRKFINDQLLATDPTEIIIESQ